MKKALSLTLLIATSSASADLILVLGDGQSEADVVPYLTSEGYTVANPNIYYDWDPGPNADLSPYDSVVMLYGYDYGYELTSNASNALYSYIQNGGNFITTSWVSYARYSYSVGGPLFDMTPVEYLGEDYDAVWDIDENSPFFAGLSDGWSDGEGFEYFDITDPSAITLGSNQYGEPLVVYTENTAGGRFVYLNHSMSYANGTVSTEGLMLVHNAITAHDVSVPEPTTFSLLGMFGLATLFVRRRSHLKAVKESLKNSEIPASQGWLAANQSRK